MFCEMLIILFHSPSTNSYFACVSSNQKVTCFGGHCARCYHSNLGNVFYSIELVLLKPGNKILRINSGKKRFTIKFIFSKCIHCEHTWNTEKRKGEIEVIMLVRLSVWTAVLTASKG